MKIHLCTVQLNHVISKSNEPMILLQDIPVLELSRKILTGSFQQVNADVHNISKGSVSNITKDVIQCLNSICRQYIKMPTDRAELRNRLL
jgi:hypothetical protein